MQNFQEDTYFHSHHSLKTLLLYHIDFYFASMVQEILILDVISRKLYQFYMKTYIRQQY